MELTTWDEWEFRSQWSESSGITYNLSESSSSSARSISAWFDDSSSELNDSYTTLRPTEDYFEAALENVRHQQPALCEAGCHRLHLSITPTLLESVRLQLSCRVTCHAACIAAQKARHAADCARALGTSFRSQ